MSLLSFAYRDIRRKKCSPLSFSLDIVPRDTAHAPSVEEHRCFAHASHVACCVARVAVSVRSIA